MASQSAEVSRRLLQDVNFALQTNTRMKIHHHSFILDVLRRCMDDNETFNAMGEPRTTPSSDKKNVTRKTKQSSETRDEFRSLTGLQKNAQNLASNIKEHFIQVVDIIADLLHRIPGSGATDIWACYESMFFLQTFTEIEQIYVCAYDGDSKLLQKLLPSANPRNMRLRGEWIVDILDPGTTESQGQSEDDAPAPRTKEIGIQTTFRTVAIQTDPTSSDEEEQSSRRQRESQPKHARKSEHAGNVVHQEVGFIDRRNNRAAITQPQQVATHTEGNGDSNMSRSKNLPDIIDSSCNLTQQPHQEQYQVRSESIEARNLSGVTNEKTSGNVETPLCSLETLYPVLSNASQRRVGHGLNSSKSIEKPRHGQITHGDTASGKGRPRGFLQLFEQAYHYLDMVLQEKLPLMRLQLLVRCLQSISDTVEKEVARATKNKQSVGNDDLLPSLLLFLIKTDPGKVTALYPQLKFLEDYLPDFIASGISGFTVTQFSMAYAVIIDNEYQKY